jgi:hypothetical protein
MMTSPLAVRLEACHGLQPAGVLAVLRDRIGQRCATAVVERAADPQVILATASDLPPEAFRIEQAGTAVRVAGGSPRGLLYWQPDCPAEATLREYSDYEFSPACTDDVVEIVRILETNASRQYTRVPVNAADAHRASDLADAVARRLPTWARRN